MKRFKEHIKISTDRVKRREGKVLVDMPKRGFSLYPTNGFMTTKWMIRLDGEKIWRRVYERWNRISNKPYPVIKLQANEFRELTSAEKELMDYDPKMARKITKDDVEENNTFRWLR